MFRETHKKRPTPPAAAAASVCLYHAMAFSRLLRVLSETGRISKGKTVHAKMIASGLIADVYACNNLMSMYVKCGYVDHARNLFDHMMERNHVSWTILISGYAKLGPAEEAVDALRSMVSAGFAPNDFTFASAISACAAIGAAGAGKEIHGRIYRAGGGRGGGDPSNNFISNALVSLYAKSGALDRARKVFDGISNPNLVSWSSIISGCCQCGEYGEALGIFSQARREGSEINEFVYASALGACADIAEPGVGKQLHCHVVKSGHRSDMFVEVGIVDLYVKCGDLGWACRAFSEPEVPSLASSSALIAGFAQHGQERKAMDLFSKLRSCGLKPNEHTFSSAIVACSNASAIEGAKQLHSLIVKLGFRLVAYIGNALVDLYAKCGSLEESTKFFEEMLERDIVSWNTLIAGYVGQGKSEGVAELLKHMLLDGMHPNLYTYSSILSLCGDLPAVGWGKQTHSCTIKPGFDTHVVVGSALTDMYAKCGRLADARKVFRKLTVKNLVSWNAMLVGYAQHGFWNEALEMFDMMQEENIKPNDITFIGVLSACGHVGLIEEGKGYFDSMTRDHGIVPRIDHFACMVDLFARGGQVTRAYEFIRGMPMEPDKVIWRSLLSGCKTHGDLGLGRYVTECILKIDPDDVSARVMLSGVYADSEMWEERAESREAAKKGPKKVPGRSWIEVKNRIHYFIAGDELHDNHREDIFEIVKSLAVQMMDSGYASNTAF